jgi:transforming growth factor-beta-induced protein
MMKSLLLKAFPAVLFGAILLGTSSCDDDDDDNNNVTPKVTIADIVSSDPNFSILKEVLTTTNLTAALDDESARLTVFAPTNTAFAALLTELGYADLNAAVNGLGVDGLRSVVLYHVLGAEVPSSQVTSGFATTLSTNADGNGLALAIDATSGVALNGSRAMVTQVDVQADNGVIHVIDKVLLPITVGELILGNPNFSTLETAALAADASVASTITNSSLSLTIFAPDNNAFGSLLTELNLPDLNAVVAAVGGVPGLTNVLLYHALTSEVRAADVTTTSVTAAQNGTLNLAVNGGSVTITDESSRTADVTAVDITGTNGVIHVINKVLLPN